MSVISQDPVAAGYSRSPRESGRKYTGHHQDSRDDLSGKRLELLKEAVPTLSRIGVLWSGVGIAGFKGLRSCSAGALKLRSAVIGRYEAAKPGFRRRIPNCQERVGVNTLHYDYRISGLLIYGKSIARTIANEAPTSGDVRVSKRLRRSWRPDVLRQPDDDESASNVPRYT